MAAPDLASNRARAVLAEAAAIMVAQTISTVKYSGNRYIYRWEWPGILRVYARGNGQLLAESLPGQPGTLSPGFTPPRSEGDPARG